MEERRSHQPRHADACDVSVGYEYVDVERSRMEQGGDCSTNVQEIIELLQVLQIHPDRFKGVFQQEHQPCPSWNKHIYEHLKKEKTSRIVTKPKPERLRQEKQKQDWSKPKPTAAMQSNMVKPGVEQSGMGMFSDRYGDEPDEATWIRNIDPIDKKTGGRQTRVRTATGSTTASEDSNGLPQTTSTEHAERDEFLPAEVHKKLKHIEHVERDGFTIMERYKKPKPKPIGPAERDGFMIAEQYTKPNSGLRIEAIENVGGTLARNQTKEVEAIENVGGTLARNQTEEVTLSTENAPWRTLNHMRQGLIVPSTLKSCGSESYWAFNSESYGQPTIGGYVV